IIMDQQKSKTYVRCTFHHTFGFLDSLKFSDIKHTTIPYYCYLWILKKYVIYLRIRIDNHTFKTRYTSPIIKCRAICNFLFRIEPFLKKTNHTAIERSILIV